MSQLDDIVSVNIQLKDAAITRASFGIPLIASFHDFWPETVRTFFSRDEAITAGLVSGSVTDKIVTALLSQDNDVESFKIGKRVNAFDQDLRVLPKNTTEGFVYTFTVTAPGALSPTTITYTVVALDTIPDITAAIAAQIDAIVGMNAADTATTVNFSADVNGELADVAGWIQVGDFDALEFFDVTGDPGLLADLDAIEAFDSDWYGLLLDSNSKNEAEVAAAFILTKTKIFGYQSSDFNILNPVITVDVFSVIQATLNNRTIQHYTQVNLMNFVAAARFGDRLPTDPASSTWKFKGAAGVSVESTANLKDADINAIKAKGGEVLITVAGNNFFIEGAAAGGRFIDLTRGIDELGVRIQEDLLSIFLNNEKVDFTTSGIGLIQGTVLATLNSKVGLLLAADPAPEVRVPLASEVPQNDKALRILADVEFSARASGAIHSVVIQGFITL